MLSSYEAAPWRRIVQVAPMWNAGKVQRRYGERGEWCVGIAGLRCWLHRNMYVFIIPRLIVREREKERRMLRRCRLERTWKGCTRVLCRAVSVMVTTLGTTIRKPRNCSDCGRSGRRESGSFDFLRLLVALDLSINWKGARWRVSLPIETRAMYVFLFLQYIGERDGDIFLSVGRGLQEQRRISRQSSRYD